MRKKLNTLPSKEKKKKKENCYKTLPSDFKQSQYRGGNSSRTDRRIDRQTDRRISKKKNQGNFTEGKAESRKLKLNASSLRCRWRLEFLFRYVFSFCFRLFYRVFSFTVRIRQGRVEKFS